jgi:hypothetical protein
MSLKTFTLAAVPLKKAQPLIGCMKPIVLDIHETRSWPFQSYDHSHNWFNHELTAHRGSWQCVEGCGLIFTTEHEFETHVRTLHLELILILSAVRSTSLMKPIMTEKATCLPALHCINYYWKFSKAPWFPPTVTSPIRSSHKHQQKTG